MLCEGKPVSTTVVDDDDLAATAKHFFGVDHFRLLGLRLCRLGRETVWRHGETQSLTEADGGEGTDGTY
jgi:hypothetical protein